MFRHGTIWSKENLCLAPREVAPEHGSGVAVGCGCVGLGVLVAVAVAVGVRLGVVVGVRVGVQLAVGVCVGVNVAVGVGVGVAVGVGVEVGMADGAIVGEAVGTTATDVDLEAGPQAHARRMNSGTMTRQPGKTRCFISSPYFTRRRHGPSTEPVPTGNRECLLSAVEWLQDPVS